jgi:uncharacterized membrane protein
MGAGGSLDRVERGALLLLLAFTVIALVGFAVFGLRPDRLSLLPVWAAQFYGVSFRFFAQGQVWLAALVLFVHLHRRAGFAWVPALAVLYGISLLSELLGTGYGIPFGEYRYSELLGAAWAGRVPWVIPLSWFLMSVPSYALSRRTHPENAAARVLLGSVILLSWDLALDPAMSHATRYWIWGETGPYYGMPWLNLFGWYVTGVVLMTALVWLRSDGWIAKLSVGWLAAYYGVNLLLPLGMSAAAGLAGAVVATLLAMGVAGGWVYGRMGRHARERRTRAAEVAG